MNKREREFERIYADNYRRVYAFLLRLSHDPGVAEELTQETFFQAYKSLARYDGRCQMYTWLIAIAKNLFLKHLRKTRRESMLIDLLVTDPEAPLEADPGYRLMREVEAARVRRAIRAIPKKYGEVLILRIYGDLPYEEIGRKLGISANSAKVIFYRAKKYIREELLND